MSFTPVPPIEVFAEALSVPAWVNAPPVLASKALAMGAFALPLVNLALRFPSTIETIVVADEGAPLPQDKRVTRHTRVGSIPSGWQADVAALAITGTPDEHLRALKTLTTPDATCVVAVDNFRRGREIKDTLRGLWKHVLPYREYSPTPALFFLVSDRKLGAPTRAWPQGLKRLNPIYLSSLFALAKDEYQFLFGEPPCRASSAG